MGSQPVDKNDIPLSQYYSGLEPAPQNFPEVSRRESRAPELAYYYNQDPYDPHAQAINNNPHLYPPQQTAYPAYLNLPKPDDPYGGSQTGGINSPYPFSPNSQTAVLSQSNATITRQRQTILGCSRIVFFLSCAIGFLSAAVIGLAAMTGVESVRANNNEQRAASLSTALASATAALAAASENAPSPDPTGTLPPPPSDSDFSLLTNGCSTDPEGTTGKNYTAFTLLGSRKFTMACNKDTIYPPLLSLFAADFQTCMDACSGYTLYIPRIFDPKNENTTCGAVSFIPLWTVKTRSEKGQAPGNCYLKRAPMVIEDLKPSNIGTECHSAVLVDGFS